MRFLSSFKEQLSEGYGLKFARIMTCNVNDVASLTSWSECQERVFVKLLFSAHLKVEVKIYAFGFILIAPPGIIPENISFAETLTCRP